MARIAVFSLTFHPFVGGAEVAIAEIAKRLPVHEFTVFTARLRPDLPARESIGAVAVVRVGSGTFSDKYRYPWLAPAAAAAEHRRQPFDSIWGMMASWGGWAALKFKDAHPKVPYILTEQSGDSDAFIAARTWFWRWRYRQIYTRADRVTAISRFLVRRAESFGARDVALVPNGVDIARFSQPAGGAGEASHGPVPLPDAPCVITVSRLVGKNGVDILIAALGLLRQRQVNVNLLVVGSGPLAATLRAQAARLGLQSAVQFLGFVEHAQLPILLQSAQVFARPSRSEGFGLSFVEAMAAGVPVVATAVGGIPDFIHDGATGMLCPPNDPRSVADAVQRLLNDDSLRQRLTANAGRLVRERYDWTPIARQMDGIFTEVMRKP